MSFVLGLRCVSCGVQYPPGKAHTCAACGDQGILDVEYDYAAIGGSLTRASLARRAEPSLWRYRELLPIDEQSAIPPLPVGQTPIASSPALARHLGIGSIQLKDDGRNPTGSLKDRASVIGVVKAREQQREIIACASTGNAASSLAGMAAALGLKSVIFVPKSTPEPKLVQLLVFGATVLRVQGSYDEAFQLCERLCRNSGWYNRNCAVNPFLIEGKKTTGLEICEQTGWEPPEWVAVSVGDGCTLAGIWKGFREMKTLGLIDRTPRMLGVQAEGAAPITAAFRTGKPVQPIAPCTIADSIQVGVPRNWRKAINAIAESGGHMIDVSDAEIVDAIAYTGRLAGVFAEPAAATAVAGLRRAVAAGLLDSRSHALAVITGNGLKDPQAIRSTLGGSFDVAADGTEVGAILRERGLLA